MAQDQETRDRVRALVRQVLADVPAEEPPAGEAPAAPAPAVYPQRVVVNSLQDKSEKEFDRDESAKTLLTEDDLRGLEAGARVRVADGARLTPLAADIVAEKGLVLVRKTSRAATSKIRSVAVGCDHGGFEYKQKLAAHLAARGLSVRDFGTNSKEAVDYPDFAHAVARAVGEGRVEAGIIIDGAGIGSAMAANKVPNVRAAACYSVALARNSREHNGANVLTLGSGQNDFGEIVAIVDAWLDTDLTEERHKKRVGKIAAIDREHRR